MSETPFLPRRLSYQDDSDKGREPKYVAHSNIDTLLHKRAEARGHERENIVILGEAGMGKTRLMEKLAAAHDGARSVSARRLASASDPKSLIGNATRVFIDAFDEAPALKEGNAIDKVLDALARAGYPPFALACRVEDWQSATNTMVINAYYSQNPLVLHLCPLDQEQIEGYIAQQLADKKQAEKVYRHYSEHAMSEWLGNPQTLEMVVHVAQERLAQNKRLPETTSALFREFINQCWNEHNPIKFEAKESSPDEVTVLDTLGAIFAMQILTDSKAFVPPQKSGVLAQKPEELYLTDPSTWLREGAWEIVKGNRLVTSLGNDRFKYLHRRIGEYLGAQWLAKCVDTEEKRERLLEKLTFKGIVPASLRGLFAWLALDQQLAERVISTDPIAVVEYGDADSLSELQAKALFAAMEKHATSENPYFYGWRKRYRAKALVRGTLLDKTLHCIADSSKPVHLRVFLSSQLQGERCSTEVVERLKAIVLDVDHYYIVRREVLDSLITNIDVAAMRELAEVLRRQATQDSRRLANDAVLHFGVEHFSDQQIVDTIFSYGGFPSSQDDDESLVYGVFYGYRTAIDDERLESFLDIYCQYCDKHFPEYPNYKHSEFFLLGKKLLSRCLQLGFRDPKKLWAWFCALCEEQSYASDDDKALQNFLRANHDIRRDIQLHALIQANTREELSLALFRIKQKPALSIEEEDSVSLLERLPADYPHWRDLIEEFLFSFRKSETLRQAALRYVKTISGGEKWLASLLERIDSPPKHDSEIEQEKREKSEKRKRDAIRTKDRKVLGQYSDAIRHGSYEKLIYPAFLYMGRFRDSDQETDPRVRLAEWLGEDLTQIVLEGFEAYLTRSPIYPTAEDTAKKYAEKTHLCVLDVLIAALNEKICSGESLDDISDDYLISTQLAIENGQVFREKFEPLIDAVREQLIARPQALERYMRLLVEPYLDNKSEHVWGLHGLLHEPWDRGLAVALSIEWLERFLDMAVNPETDMIDFLLREGQHAHLKTICTQRLSSNTLDIERQRNWQAILLITDFAVGSMQLANIAKRDRDMLWTLRDRLSWGQGEMGGDSVSVALAYWIVRHYRLAFLSVYPPSGESVGDRNSWDATRYIWGLIDNIASHTSDDARAAMEDLAQVNDSYRDYILTRCDEQKRNHAESHFTRIEEDDIVAILKARPPQSHADLQTYMLQLLRRVEKKIESNSTDCWKVFYRGDKLSIPQDEEYCRDRLIDLLEAEDEHNILLSSESRLAANRRTDISCSLDNGKIFLPIEVKGQWNDSLWSAADTQLAEYVRDYRADKRGIYLVLWFGVGDLPKGKRLRGKSGVPRSTLTTAKKLEAALIAHSRALQGDRIRVCVLDIS